MEFHHYHHHHQQQQQQQQLFMNQNGSGINGNGMYSPGSTTSSTGSTSSSDGMGHNHHHHQQQQQQQQQLAADELGLRMLVYGFYSPYLVNELERLFVLSPAETVRLNSSGNPVKSVWDDFENNGQETELDELDRLFRGMDVGELCKKMAPPTAASSSSVTSSPLSSIIDASNQMQMKASHAAAVEEILTKASLIEILRERERLQRSRTKKVQKKTSANKVCVFCRNNGEAESVYTSHQLKDPEGNITCPILYIYTCPICGANGKTAHTIKYCPYNTGETLTMCSLSKNIRPISSSTAIKHLVPFI